MDRFAFQRDCVEQVSGTVLNIGCNEDPASLKGTFGERVVNCDAYTNNNGVPYPIDCVFDCTEERWPFEDQSVDLIVFGDIIEHFYPDELSRALDESYRVGKSICITVPEDHRILEDGYKEAIKDLEKGVVHVHLVTEDYLRGQLRRAGWEPRVWHEVDYGFVPRGFLVVADRVPLKGFEKLMGSIDGRLENA